ncbi:hypothetical protein VTI28DRAFT_5968 [Corynascus sepedonium]
MPTGPVVVWAKIDRGAFRHLAPSMNPLSDADSSSTVLRKGKPAIACAIRQLSDMLFGHDIEPSEIRHVLPQPGAFTPLDAEPLLLSKYVCFYWLRRIPSGELLSSALVELTSASELVDNCLEFHAIKVTNEDYKVLNIATLFHDEE